MDLSESSSSSRLKSLLIRRYSFDYGQEHHQRTEVTRLDLLGCHFIFKLAVFNVVLPDWVAIAEIAQNMAPFHILG